jgi:glycosyltransferase involved in cell wall biosynthesis
VRVLIMEQGGRGGVTDYAEQLVIALAGEGVDVELGTATDNLYPPMPGVHVLPVFPYLRATNALNRALRRVKLHWIYNAVGYLLAVARLLPTARRCRVVHMQGYHFPPLTITAMLAYRAVGARIVHTPHNTFDRHQDVGLGRRLMEQLPVQVIVHTQADMERLPAAVRAKATVIPHGEYGALARSGGTPDRAQCRAELGVGDAELAVLLFGQLRIDKGLEDLLIAVRDTPGVRAIVGGQDLGALGAAAELLAELGPRVIVHEGFLEMTDAARLFAAGDVVAVPYREASASGVLVLAYGFARPVVVYPSGGLPEAVDDGETGWICARAEPSSLADALADAIAVGPAERERRGENGRRLAEERFGWPAIARATEKVYAQALS